MNRTPTMSTISIATLIAFAALLVSPSSTEAALIAHWSADGNANDSVAARNGTLIGDTSYGTGVLGQAFQFDGTNDRVDVPDDAVWTFGGDFTISLWTNFDSVNADIIQLLPNVFIGHDEGGGEKNKWVFFYDDDGQLAFHINSPSLTPLFLTSPSSFTPTLGQWHHVAVTRSLTTFTFYADGTSLGTATSGAVIPDANANLTIGEAEGLGDFDGRLDEIRIYESALSASQIQQLASVQNSIPEPTSCLIWSAVFMAFRLRRRAATR